MDQETRIRTLKSQLNSRVVIVDGAMGTSIQALNLAPSDFGGPEFDGCNEYLNLLQPEIIKNIHRTFLEAGADILETNSFGATPLVLGEYGLADKAQEINKVAAELAREVATEYSSQSHLRFVAGSMGPTTKAISVTGGVTWDELAEHYYIQALGLIQGNADFLLLETSQDTLNVKAALEGIDRASAKLGIDIPVAVQCTIETMGTTLGGQDIESFYTSIAHRNLLWIGMNCATGPSFMRDHLRTLSSMSRFPIAAIPNAGLPDENGAYNETPEILAGTLGDYLNYGWTNIIGGCCGTTPEHIKSLVQLAQGKEVSHTPPVSVTAVSGLDHLIIEEDNRPIIVGERTNVLGSRRFKRLISEGKFEEAAEIGRHQVRGGAHVLDVCLQDPDRDEVSDVSEFLEILIRKVKAPLVIDSTDQVVIEESLKRTPGKSIINSINLEDGEERFNSVVPLARRYGAALVVGCIDDDKTQAQAITRERKLEVAKRSYNLLTRKYGVPGEDIIFDPLVFPIGTGDENYIGAGLETIEGVRVIKEKFPDAKTILGISNVSFGLPPAGREVLNSVFLYHCVQAGLDLAIVNSQAMMRYASIPEEDRAVCENLIWWQGEDPIRSFADHFRERKVETSQADRDKLPLRERISRCIIEGTKEGLTGDLDQLLNESGPLEIINGPLMAGMDEVGRLFASNELIVAEVLESAEAMKAAVSHLEPHMESEGLAESRGTIILATVKGDVHDIGKNLVDIILSNNGFKVINLGIRVPPFDLIEASKTHNPDMIGLSGLLVKSAQMMVDTARDFQSAGLGIPILVGGAALTNRFTRLRIAPEYDSPVVYAQDAMTGLSLAGQLADPKQREQLALKLGEESKSILASVSAAQPTSAIPRSRQTTPKSQVQPINQPPIPPDLVSHVILDHDLTEIFPYINPTMLYVRHLGFRGRFQDLLEKGDPKAIELQQQVNSVENDMLSNSKIQAKAVYKFFRAASDGDDVVILSSDGQIEIERFHFGRQNDRDKLCLSDYLQPKSSGIPDYVGMFVTSIGPGIREIAENWRIKGDYLRSHILQILAIEGAEGFAELLHERMRLMLGIGDPPMLTKEDLFRTNYQGKRFSFGYPACPRLEDQEKLWKLLDPNSSIQVDLTEGFMMDPEGSVSAIVFHHPEAKYFNLDEADIDALEHKISMGGENSPSR